MLFQTNFSNSVFVKVEMFVIQENSTNWQNFNKTWFVISNVPYFLTGYIFKYIVLGENHRILIWGFVPGVQLTISQD